MRTSKNFVDNSSYNDPQDPGTVLDISPDTVHAVDQDSLRAEVEYQLEAVLYCTVLHCTVL